MYDAYFQHATLLLEAAFDNDKWEVGVFHCFCIFYLVSMDAFLDTKAMLIEVS